MKLPLHPYERNVTSQTGEDGVIERILALVGEGGKAAVEFGAGNGFWFSNTWRLEHECGWKRFLFDGDAQGNPQVHEVYLTAENINEVFDKASVPRVIDVMSVDTDGNDFWLWEALNRRSRIVIAEFNTSIYPTRALAIRYNPNHRWDNTTYYGASLSALNMLANARGLRLVHCTFLNAIFLNSEEADRAGLEEIPVKWDHRIDLESLGGIKLCSAHRQWVEITPELLTPLTEES